MEFSSQSKQHPYQQMDAIHELLDDDRQRLCVEAHSVPLICIVVGLLTAFSGDLFRFLFPANDKLTIGAESAFIITVITLTLIIDQRWTQARRRMRGDILPLLHKKVMQIIWTVIGIGVLLSTYIMLQVGPGKLTLWFSIFVFGLVLYIVGLFSHRWYTTSGVMLLGLGIVALLFVQPGTAFRLVTACVFVVGGPLVQILLPYANSPQKRLICSSAWLCAVTLASLCSYNIHYSLSVQPEQLPVYSLTEYRQQHPAGKVIVSLPAGSEITIKSLLGFDVFRDRIEHDTHNRLRHDYQVVVNYGHLTGTFRRGHGKWREIKDSIERQRFPLNIDLLSEFPSLQHRHNIHLSDSGGDR